MGEIVEVVEIIGCMGDRMDRVMWSELLKNRGLGFGGVVIDVDDGVYERRYGKEVEGWVKGLWERGWGLGMLDGIGEEKGLDVVNFV